MPVRHRDDRLALDAPELVELGARAPRVMACDVAEVRGDQGGWIFTGRAPFTKLLARF